MLRSIRMEEKKTEGLKEDNINSDKSQEQEEQQHLSLSAKAYKLFSEGKTPIEVAIELNLRESDATKFCREYWKLKQLYNLNIVYEEIKDDIASFLKLYRLAKAKGIGVRHIVDILANANNDLPAIEERFKRLRNDVSMLQSQKHTCKRDLYQLNNQIATTTRLLNSIRISCERERRELEEIYNEKKRLEDIVTRFKRNNEEYLKIKEAAEENVKSFLNNSKILLNFAIASVIESLRRNREIYDFVLSDDICAAFILEEAEKLYNKLTTKLTNEVMAAVAAIKTIPSLPLRLPSSNNSQKLNYENDTYEKTKETNYNNNHSKIYINDQPQPNE